MYCRECIYKYLLDQKQKLKRARKKYEEQLAELAEEATASQQAEEDRKLQACRNAVCVCVCVCVWSSLWSSFVRIRARGHTPDMASQRHITTTGVYRS